MHDHLRHLRPAALAALALTLSLAAPAAAQAHTLSAHRGALSASFSYQTVHSRLRAQITITRAGRVLYRAPLSPSVCGGACRPASVGALSIRNLGPGAGRAAVVLELVSGQNGCCAIAEVLTDDPAHRTYATAARNFGVPELAIRHLGPDGQDEFVSADGSFSARFTDAAMSGLPVRVWAWDGSGFVNDTLAHPQLVAADARRWLAAYRAAVSGHDSLGFFAAWAADEDELGAMDTTLDPFLSAEVADGNLSAPTMSGRRFAALLPSFLSARGYVPMCGG